MGSRRCSESRVRPDARAISTTPAPSRQPDLRRNRIAERAVYPHRYHVPVRTHQCLERPLSPVGQREQIELILGTCSAPPAP